MPERKTAIVTGAGSGIGREIALALARKGCAVVLAARREQRLRDVAGLCRQVGAEARVRPTDVGDREQVNALVADALEEFGRLDVMVNNAGFGVNGLVHELDERDLRDIFQVNFYGLWYGCAAAAPAMIRQGGGHIFNVSSVIGRRGTPYNGAYCATKAAVNGLTEALRVELSPHGVRVTLVLPGMTDTEFFGQVRGGSPGHARSFRAVRTRQSPAVVARKVAATVGKSTPELVFTPGGKLLVKLAALAPRLVDRMMECYRRALAGQEGR